MAGQDPSYPVLPLHLLRVSGNWSYGDRFDDAESAAMTLENFELPVDLHYHPTQDHYVNDVALSGLRLFDSLGRPVRLTAFMTALLHFSLADREPSPYAAHVLRQKGLLKQYQKPTIKWP